MDFFSTQNILVHIPIGAGGYDLSWIEGWPVSDLLCVRADKRHAVCDHLLPDPALRQPASTAVLLRGQYLWLVRLVSAKQPAGGGVANRWLPLPKAIACAGIGFTVAFLTRVAVGMSGWDSCDA
ncbi:nicotinamide riboside transporter PnuC domain protein [Enterobacter hormaechei subsp. xiangfangensis]|nr:nicotinamide riboside transporter PnuC domain protein [Enterobacter hormaechei subsp. xiangfangensis]